MQKKRIFLLATLILAAGLTLSILLISTAGAQDGIISESQREQELARTAEMTDRPPASPVTLFQGDVPFPLFMGVDDTLRLPRRT